MSHTAAELAQRIDATVQGDESVIVTDVQPVDKAETGHLTFISDESHLKKLETCAASVVILSAELAEKVERKPDVTWLLVKDAQAALIEALRSYRPTYEPKPAGVSPDTWIHESAQISESATIYPGVYISEDVVIGDHCVLYPGVFLGPGCTLGTQVTLYPHVVLYQNVVVEDQVTIHANTVIGADGFSYRQVEGRHEKVPQLGGARIEQHVEIGSCTTVDCGAINPTVIGEGTKLDNLVMVAHNCELGKHNILVSQVGFAGSITTGDYVVCAGQVGVADHVHLGTGTILASKSGVNRDLPGGEAYIGSPAIPIKEGAQALVAVRKLPQMRQQVRSLEKELAELKEQVQQMQGPSEKAA